jgi:hypothetical protein
MRDAPLRIGLVYPELLGTYGDRGNALVLAQRCRWRGIPAEIVEVAAGDPVPATLDCYLLGGGEDDPQHLAAAGLRASRASLVRAHEEGAVVFAVCAGFQLLGHSYVAADGTVLDGIGLVDARTTAGPTRLIGEVVVEPDAPLPLLTGFENHGGRTTLGPGVGPGGRGQRRRLGHRRRPGRPARRDLPARSGPAPEPRARRPSPRRGARAPPPARLRVGGAPAGRTPRRRVAHRPRPVVAAAPPGPGVSDER